VAANHHYYAKALSSKLTAAQTASSWGRRTGKKKADMKWLQGEKLAI